MKKTLTRILSLVLAVIAVFGLMTAPASAASGLSVSDSTGTVKVDTSGGKFVVVTKSNAKLKTKANSFSSTYVTCSKGTLLQINGSNGDYYKVKMGGTNYYILKSDVKKAGTYNANIDYTVNNKNSAVRTGPAAKSDIAFKLPKGTAFLLCGTLRRADNSNLWLVVYDTNSRNLVYLYSGNSACVCTQVKLTVSASTNTVNTRGTLQLKASYSPSALTNSITWTSSNPAVATVSSKGVVTGITAGTATITATVDGLNGTVSVSTNITVSPKIQLDVPVLRQYDSKWKNKYIAKSNATIGKYGCLLTSISAVYSYDTGKTVTPDAMDDLLKFTSGGALYWDSLEKYGYSRHSHGKKVSDAMLSAIYEQLKQGNPVIIGGKNAKGGTHWVTITGFTGSSSSSSSFKASLFTIMDSGNSKRTTLQDFINSYPTISSLVY